MRCLIGKWLFLDMAAAGFIAAILLSSVAAGQETQPLSLESHIPLPNVKGRIDHLSVDVNGQRLFVAAVDNHTLEVIDLKSDKRIHTIVDLAEPQGVLYDAPTNRLFVACALDGVTKIFDGTTFQVLAPAKFPDDADNIRYDSHGKHVVVGYAGAKQLRKRETGSGGLGFLDTDGKKVSDIVIDAHPESFSLKRSDFAFSSMFRRRKKLKSLMSLSTLSWLAGLSQKRTTSQWPSTKLITGCLWRAGNRRN